ncbi:Amino acid transporter [Geosmithia morbida]|uniref:Amino acid transporter n=1 Tax=Geosmithia morbida TaxID=1094350 RepID=A0A9P4YU88_9HYPO|nr:Amino acid transporter [Geosmithia morbida]KAF4121884.1 Amino acid transporter [Geosmithia morbida]
MAVLQQLRAKVRARCDRYPGVFGGPYSEIGARCHYPGSEDCHISNSGSSGSSSSSSSSSIGPVPDIETLTVLSPALTALRPKERNPTMADDIYGDRLSLTTWTTFETTSPSRAPSTDNFRLGRTLSLLIPWRKRSRHRNSDTKSNINSSDSGRTQVQNEELHRPSLSLKNMTFLMSGELIGLALHSFPQVFEVLGVATGMATLFTIAAMYWYTSMVCWKLCLRHPEARSVSDVGRIVFGKLCPRFGQWFTASVWALGVLIILAVHIRAGGEIFDVIIEGSPNAQHALRILPQGGAFIGYLVCGILCFACALPRKPLFLSRFIGLASMCTLLTAPLCTAFFLRYGTKEHANLGGAEAALASATATATSSTMHWWWNGSSDSVAKMLAILHMTFAFLGQPSCPTFIADMAEPRDFPKALAGSLSVQLASFASYGTVCYWAVGSAAMTSPVFKALPGKATGLTVVIFMMPATVGQAALFGSLLARFLWHTSRLEDWAPPGSRWWKRQGSWAAMQAFMWTLSGSIIKVVPQFDSLLALVASIPGSYLFYVLWCLAWLRMFRADHLQALGRCTRPKRAVVLDASVNVVNFAAGIFVLGAGTAAAVAFISRSASG